MILDHMLCKKDEFPCQGEEIRCIPMTWACDGVADCKEAEDENADTCGNYCEHKMGNPSNDLWPYHG